MEVEAEVAEEKEEEEKKEKNNSDKSNNPHLAGGELTGCMWGMGSLSPWRYLVYSRLLLFGESFNIIQCLAIYLIFGNSPIRF